MNDNYFINPPLDFLCPNPQIPLEDFIEFSKAYSELSKGSENNIPKRCHICNCDLSSFCNSHTLPQFCLRNIAENGIIMTPGTILGGPIREQDIGISKTGTFHLICKKCDKEQFATYEDPAKYVDSPSREMLCQIAMKTALRMIYKRYIEIGLYKNISSSYKLLPPFLDCLLNTALKEKEIDFLDYQKDLNYTKKALEKDINDAFYLGYYKKLNYNIPIATQIEIVLITDFEGRIINDIYNDSKTYKLHPMQICLFPLKEYSVIFIFAKERHTRLRSFFKTLNSLSEKEQLQIISYLVFLYSEDVYMSRRIKNTIINNPIVRDTVNTSGLTLGLTSDPLFTLRVEKIQAIKTNYDLNKFRSFPNLLSPEFKID